MSPNSEKFMSTLELSQQLSTVPFTQYDDTQGSLSTIPPSAQPDKRKDDRDEDKPPTTTGAMKLDLKPIEKMIVRIIEEKVDERLTGIMELLNMLANHLGLVRRGS